MKTLSTKQVFRAATRVAKMHSDYYYFTDSVNLHLFLGAEFSNLCQELIARGTSYTRELYKVASVDRFGRVSL